MHNRPHNLDNLLAGAGAVNGENPSFYNMARRCDKRPGNLSAAEIYRDDG
jgi:hypothetical protein